MAGTSPFLLGQLIKRTAVFCVRTILVRLYTYRRPAIRHTSDFRKPPGGAKITLSTFMDSETISTLKTVCTAGRACEGYNGDQNRRLEDLADMGLLVVSQAPSLIRKRRAYEPTQKGWELYKQVAS